jgi:hypothetical protein
MIHNFITWTSRQGLPDSTAAVTTDSRASPGPARRSRPWATRSAPPGRGPCEPGEPGEPGEPAGSSRTPPSSGKMPPSCASHPVPATPSSASTPSSTCRSTSNPAYCAASSSGFAQADGCLPPPGRTPGPALKTTGLAAPPRCGGAIPMRPPTGPGSSRPAWRSPSSNSFPRARAATPSSGPGGGDQRRRAGLADVSLELLGTAAGRADQGGCLGQLRCGACHTGHVCPFARERGRGGAPDATSRR